MKKLRFLIFILSAILVSCNNLIDEDLGDGYSVTVQSPNDSLVTNSFTVTFWWEEMVEASRYKIQAVHPDFDAVEYVVFDTIITDNSFTYTFETKGQYQFRIRAENNTSETNYVTRTFTIDNTIDLAEHTLIVVSPMNNFATNSTELEFKWVNIPVADEYLFSVQKDDSEGEYIVEPTLLYDNRYVLNNTIAPFNQGTYYWSVQAKNDVPSKTAAVTRTFIVDRTAPGIPVSLFPVNDTILTQKTITFRYERYDDGTGAPVFDTLYLLKKNASEIYEVFKKERNATNLSELTISALPSGNYKWYIKTFDTAKNGSDKSGDEAFIIE